LEKPQTLQTSSESRSKLGTQKLITTKANKSKNCRRLISMTQTYFFVLNFKLQGDSNHKKAFKATKAPTIFHTLQNNQNENLKQNPAMDIHGYFE
jgi:hypothetical protein